MGTASAMPLADKHQSAQALSVHGRWFIIDCGDGIQRLMMKNHVPWMKVDAVFISHIHGDHVFGIFGFLSSMGMMGRHAPLAVYGPGALGPVIKFFLSYWGEGLPYRIDFHPLKMRGKEVVLETGPMTVSAFPLNHGIETFGFLFRENRPFDAVSYAYCSDTAAMPELSEWVRGVTVLYHETTYLMAHEDKAAEHHHSTTCDAARLALEAGASKLIIGHYSSRDRDIRLYESECREIFPETYAAKDGDVFDFGK